MAARRELRALWPFAAVLALLWPLGVLVHRALAPRAGPEIPPWQRSFRELSMADQRLFRELREGLLDAENARAATGSWPEPAQLADAGVPPFAPGPLTPELRWTRRQQGPYVNYLGEPDAGLRWLIVFIEPERKPSLRAEGEPPPPPPDEEHHTLADGTALHVTVWTEPSVTRAPTEVLAFPVTEGWTQRVGR